MSTMRLEKGRIIFKTYDVSKVYGPFRFYVRRNAVEQITVDSDQIRQDWGPNNRFVEASFPYTAIQNAQGFYWTAVTLVPREERYLDNGIFGG